MELNCLTAEEIVLTQTLFIILFWNPGNSRIH